MILSFDLGLKNMGACALDKNNQIVSWTILNIQSIEINNIVLALDTWISCVCDHSENIVFVLERQPYRNHKMTKLSIIMHTYFKVAFPSYKVYQVSSNMKWKYLKREVPQTYHLRKNEAIKACTNELHLHESNTNWSQWFHSQPKQDDLADAYIQALYISFYYT